MTWRWNSCLFAAFLIALPGMAAAAQGNNDNDQPPNLGDANSAFNAYMNQPFVSDATAENYKTAIQDLVGQYITISNKQPTFWGDTELKAPTPGGAVIQLKSDTPFTLTNEETVSFGAKVASWLGLTATQGKLFQVTATNAATVLNTAVTGGNCVANRPSYLQQNVEYYCIASVTLSTITYTQYDRVGVLANGAYGIATAEGSYQQNNAKSGSITKISYTAYGPFMGDHVETTAGGHIGANALNADAVGGARMAPNPNVAGIPAKLRRTQLAKVANPFTHAH